MGRFFGVVSRGWRRLTMAAGAGLVCLLAVGTALAYVVEPHRSPTRTMFHDHGG